MPCSSSRLSSISCVTRLMLSRARTTPGSGSWRGHPTRRFSLLCPTMVPGYLTMEGMDGRDLLRRSQQIDPEIPVVVITGHGDVETAVEAMRLGAYDFIEKPFAPERFLEVVRRAGEKRQLVVENRRLRRVVNEQTLSSRIIGTSSAAEALRAPAAELAGTDV